VSLLFRSAPVEKRGTNVAAQAEAMKANMFGLGFTYQVDQESSLRHDAIWSCRMRIAQDVSMLPVDVVRYTNGQRQEVATPQIIAAPSSYIPALDWRFQVIDSWLGWGNAWGKVTAVTPDGRYPARIEILNPADVSVQSIGDQLVISVLGERLDLWPVGPLWHVPAYTLPGRWVGLSPIQMHAVKISGAIAAEQFGVNFFKDGAHPSALISTPGNPGDAKAESLKQRIMDIVRGGSREPLIMPKDTTYTPLQVNPHDSQFIETQRYSVEQICRIYGEDPADHGASAGGSSVTYANRIDAEAARIKRRQFWVTKLQDALTGLLPRPQVVKLNTSAYLMMTPLERHQLHALRLANRTETVNEVRLVEDQEPFGPEFDTPGIPKSDTESRSVGVAEAVQKVYLGVGSVVTSDEARKIVNAYGGELEVPGPADLAAAPTDGGTPA
jgi:HK97 family phage portal protein